MDGLLTLGCIILFFALVVVPILAIVALRRSEAVGSELATLRRRVEKLEQRGVTKSSLGQVTTATQISSEAIVPPVPDVVLPEPVADAPPEPVSP